MPRQFGLPSGENVTGAAIVTDTLSSEFGGVPVQSTCPDQVPTQFAGVIAAAAGVDFDTPPQPHSRTENNRAKASFIVIRRILVFSRSRLDMV